MKIEYDKDLYIKIANFPINEIVQVSNRKGRSSTIHIQNITSLKWPQLQLLMPSGEDTFSKMVLLYEKYSNHEQAEGGKRKEILAPDEVTEVNKYMKIFRENAFSSHVEVNEYITDNNIWDQFPTIRSLNDHGNYKEIPGIQPKYFHIVCQLLGITGEGGLPLASYKRY